jgi:hypothetical protein
MLPPPSWGRVGEGGRGDGQCKQSLSSSGVALIAMSVRSKRGDVFPCPDVILHGISSLERYLAQARQFAEEHFSLT